MDNDALVEELFQEVRVRLWEELPALAASAASPAPDQPANLRAWLYMIARNVTISWLRRPSRRNEPLPTDTDHLPAALAPGPASLIRFQQQIESLNQAMPELTDTEREVFILRVERALPFREIGQILHITESAARMRYQHGKERLKHLVQETTPE